MPTEIPEISIDELLARPETLLFDAYGVLVTASGALPGAPQLIARLEAEARPYFVLTNDASRLPATIAESFSSLGLAVPESRIITSGSLLPAYFRTKGLVGARSVVLGPADSRRYVELAGGVVLDPLEAEEIDAVVLCDEAGFPFLETLDAVLTLAMNMRERGRPLASILVNPDLIYPKGTERYGFTAGSMAVMLEEGSKVRFPEHPLVFEPLGKPHRPIFEEAARRAGTRALIMIGDQLRTDIQGAVDFGLEAVLCGTGLALELGAEGPRPDFTLRSLVLR